MPSGPGGRRCPNGKRKRLKEIVNRSRASIGHCQASFHRRFCLGPSAALSCRRPHGSDRFVLACPPDPRRSAGASPCSSERAPSGWTWQLDDTGKNGLPATYRAPPAPYRERAYVQGPGSCCVCGQPVYRFGWHVDLWDSGANMKANWHGACVIAWQFWNVPNGYARLLRRREGWRCC